MLTNTLSGYNNYQQHVLSIMANDEKVLKHYYQNNYPKVEKYVLDNSGTVEEAKDVYQEAFIAVWRNIQLGKFQPQHESSLDGYIYQVAKNKWLDQLRSAKRLRVVPLNERTNSVEEAPAISEEEQLLINAIKANLLLMGETCKEVLMRFYYRRESMRTISAALKWTEATAKNNKYRCLQRLRELLKTNKPNLE